MAERLAWYHHRILDGAGADLCIDIGAGDQFVTGIVDGAYHLADLAGTERLDGDGLAFDDAMPLLARERLPADRHRLSDGYAPQFGFINVDAHAQPVQIADVGD